MTTQKEVSSSDEVSLADVIRTIYNFYQIIRAERGTILRSMGTGLILGLFAAFGSGEEYTATIRILPYKAGTATSTGISGLAGLAGVRLPANVGDQTITSELYPEIAKTNQFRLSVAETPIKFSTKNRPTTAAEYFRTKDRTATQIVADYTIGIPQTLTAWLNESSETSGVQQQIDTTNSIETINQADLKTIEEISKRISITIDKKTTIVTLASTMPDQYAAADLARVASEKLMNKIIDYESKKANEHYNFVEKQSQQTRERYEKTQRELAVFSDRNRVLVTATGLIERDHLQREYDLAFEAFQQASRELQQARSKKQQDTPVFMILEPPAVPQKRSKPRRKLVVLNFLLISFLFGAGYIALRNVLTIKNTTETQ